MIKLILFDLNGVFITIEDELFVEEFSKQYHLDKKKFQDVYDQFTIQAEYGKISSEEAWKKILGYFKIKENPKKMFQKAMRFKKEIPDMFALLKRIKTKTAFITNYYPWAWEFINKKFSLEKRFDLGIVSFQIQSRKPEPKGFQIILKHFKVTPNEILFIDDGIKNVDAAQKLGMEAIHFQNKEQLERELKRVKVL